MIISDLASPATLVSLKTLQKNIGAVAAQCLAHRVSLFPMIKTHKCSAIAKMQRQAGCGGFMAGTLDEAEALSDFGLPVMAAYPISGKPNLDRARAVAAKTRLILCLDQEETALEYEAFFKAAGIKIGYLLIVDSGLHRFGTTAESAAEMAGKVSASCPHLQFCGISTHPGHVYGHDRSMVQSIALESAAVMRRALQSLEADGRSCEFVATGSTPTLPYDLDSGVFNVVRPGNYVFCDAIQLSLGAAEEADCAMRIFTRLVSHPRGSTYLIDAGSKAFGLDRGAHGAAGISGYGLLCGHPEAQLTGLSEEVGKLDAGQAELYRGQELQVIPNHACSSANLTGTYWLTEGERVIGTLVPDMRRGLRPVDPALFA